MALDKRGARRRRWERRGAECPLAGLPPITIELASAPQSWQRWRQLVQRDHDLGVMRPTGRRLHHLASAGQESIGIGEDRQLADAWDTGLLHRAERPAARRVPRSGDQQSSVRSGRLAWGSEPFLPADSRARSIGRRAGKRSPGAAAMQSGRARMRFTVNGWRSTCTWCSRASVVQLAVSNVPIPHSRGRQDLGELRRMSQSACVDPR